MFKKVMIWTVGIAFGFGLIFLGVSAVYGTITWAFDLTFSWKHSVGISIIWMLLVQLFQNARPKREKTVDEQWNDLMRRR